MNHIRNNSIPQIAKWMLINTPDGIVRWCKLAKQYNTKGWSFYDHGETFEFRQHMMKESGMPLDIVDKDRKARYYAMHSICPNAW